MSNIFHAYDIRGKYPDEINEEIVFKIAAGLVNFLNPAKARWARPFRDFGFQSSGQHSVLSDFPFDTDVSGKRKPAGRNVAYGPKRSRGTHSGQAAEDESSCDINSDLRRTTASF